jgi:hypothetical protein
MSTAGCSIRDIGPEGVIDRGDELRRDLVLAAEIMRQLDAVAGDEGAVTARDLYWNLDTFAEQFEGQRADRAEIEAICEVLARPPLSLLRRTERGLAPLGSPATASRRLRLLAALIEEGTPETEGP